VPIISDKSYQSNLTNEGGLAGTFRFLKDIMGLWLVQQCRAAWASRGRAYDYEALAEMAAAAPGFRSWIDPDDPSFLKPGDMSTRIISFCERTGQTAPTSDAEVIRCVLESLALKYRYVLALLEEASGRRVEVMHIVGGGSRNRLLCQMTANAIGRPVIAGPDEATALGNALAQWLALGIIGSHVEGRRILCESASLVRFEPRETARWDEAYARFQRLVVPGSDF
jgi:rhamnulokinase